MSWLLLLREISGLKIRFSNEEGFVFFFQVSLYLLRGESDIPAKAQVKAKAVSH